MEQTITTPGTGFVYSRIHNPTVGALEAAVSQLEKGERAVGFASGMAAIHAALLASLQTGDHIVAPASLYGGAYALMTGVLPDLGIQTTFVDDLTAASVRAALRPNTRVVYAETISNPLLRVPNLAELASVAHEHHARLVVDSTLATPCLARPLETGADLVIHSASKYFGGHGDLIAGLVVGAEGPMTQVHHKAIHAGGIMAPFIAWLILRGIQTLPLRMAQHQASAAKVADFLHNHPKVRRSIYPGLPHHPDHSLARQVLATGFGGMVAFEVDGDDAAATRVANQLRWFARAGSLGDTHSLVAQPAMSSHRPLSPESRAQAGLRPGLLRLSIGLEDGMDLVSDLEQALTTV